MVIGQIFSGTNGCPISDLLCNVLLREKAITERNAMHIRCLLPLPGIIYRPHQPRIATTGTGAGWRPAGRISLSSMRAVIAKKNSSVRR